jgi:putative ABC transport system permease protein
MTTTIERPPVSLAGGNGGAPARRAMVRWAWRLLRREWRQQVLVLALLTVAVAATTAGVAFVTNGMEEAQTTLALPGSDPQLAADVAVLRDRFGDVDIVSHQRIAVPGSVDGVDLRAQDPHATGKQPTLRLLSGRYPAGAGEVAVTRGVADLFDLRVGGVWDVNGRTRTVVGLVENPLHLNERFALVAPGQADPPARLTVHIAGAPSVQALRIPSGSPVSIATIPAAQRAAAAAVVLALATMGLLFIGLIAVAGFTVMAQRRLRALGMLGALGATDRHVRLVMLANGAAVGAVAAVIGAAAGLAGWLVFASRLEALVSHRMDRFDLPWWAIGSAMLLAVVTSVIAAWWPARSASRVPVVTALSGRPPRPQPAHRLATAGAVLLALGLALLGMSGQKRPLVVAAGTVATTLAVLFLAPLAIRVLAGAGRRAPIAVRLALRDLARYQGRAGAAAGAIALAIGIAATIAISAAASAAGEAATGGNLADDQLLVYLSPEGAGAPLPDTTPAQLQGVQAGVDAIAATLGTRDVVTLEAAVNSGDGRVAGVGAREGGKGTAVLVRVEPLEGGGSRMAGVGGLYVATPALLARYGIQAGDIDPSTDVLTARADLAGTTLLYGPRQTAEPRIQPAKLPAYGSGPNTLLTSAALQRLGLQTRVAAWLVQTDRPLTGAQIDGARKAAAGAGLTIETRDTKRSLKQLGQRATGAGMLLALGVLAMTVGLIRSETANDLRILAATGATGAARRTITGATAAALALLGALLGTAGAYAALTAWHRNDLTNLAHPPVVNLIAIVAGLPAVAGVAGWLLAGREPSAIARRPLDA